MIGYNIAHGYSLNDDGYSSNAGVFGLQTSNQLNSGVSLNTNHEGDETRHKSFVSLQQEPVRHDYNEGASSVTSLSDGMVQSKPDSEHEPDKFPLVPSVQKHEPQSSGSQQPFGLLVKDSQQKAKEGVSFSTIKDFKQFIDRLKNSFLMPGSDVRSHFQTAQEIMDDRGVFDTGYKSDSAKEGTAHYDASENVQSEPRNALLEQSEQGANYQMPRESQSVAYPVNSTVSMVPTSVYDNQDSGPGSAFYPHPPSAATEHVSSNYGNFDHGGIPEENTYILANAPDAQNEYVQSTSYMPPEQTTPGSFFGQDFFNSNRGTASTANPPVSPSQDFSLVSPPLTYEENIQEPTYTFHSKDSLIGYQQKPPGGFELGKEQGGGTPTNFLLAPEPPSLASYGKSIYVSAPSGQHYIPKSLPKHRERPAPSFKPSQPTDGMKSKDINYTPISHLPVTSGSFSSSSANLAPQSRGGHVGVQTSSPHDVKNQAFNRKQPVRPHQVFTVKPSSSLYGSRTHDGYLGDQSVSVNPPSILTEETQESEEPLDPSVQNLVIQGPKQMTDNSLIPISGGLDSTQRGLSSAGGVDYTSLNSLTNLAPTSTSETVFSRLVGNEVMSRNFGFKNIISDRFPSVDIHWARNALSSIFTPRRREMPLNGGYVGAMATRAGLLQTFIQPTKLQRRPANVNKKSWSTVYRPPKLLSASKVSGSPVSGAVWWNGGNTKRLLPQTQFVKSHAVKSRNGYTRSKASISKTHYAPYQLDEGKTGKPQWKPFQRQHEYMNAASHNAKGFEE